MQRVPTYQEYINYINQFSCGYASPFSSTPQPQAANVLPPQQVLQANGKASVDAIRMSPNSSVLIMDNTAPIVWLCTSDGLGNVTSTPYDISPHKDTPPVDAATFEGRLSTVETNLNALIQKWEELTNVKSNDGNAQPKQTGRNVGKPGTSQADG